MIVYSGVKRDFLTAVEQDSIAVEIEENIYNKMHRKTAQNEFRSWENSLEYMYKVLNDNDIPGDSGVVAAVIKVANKMKSRLFFAPQHGYGKCENGVEI